MQDSTRGPAVLNLGSMGRHVLVRTMNGFVIESFPHSGGRRLRPCRLSAGVPQEGNVHPIGYTCLFRISRSLPGFGWPMTARSPRTVKGQYALLFPLHFVRCDVCCCGAVAPRVTAALLGRFLPRLGPLAPASGPFLNQRRHRSGESRCPIRLPPGKAATPRSRSRPGNPPAPRGPRPSEQSRASARIAARPCRARG